MKRILAAALCLLMALALGACQPQKEAEKPQEDGFKIVTTIFPAYDFARQLAKDNAEIIMLLPLGSESHSYEPTLENIADIQTCDLFIYSGGDTDSWGYDIYKASNKKGIKTVCMMDEVELLPMGAHNHQDAEHSHDAEMDEHIWTSPKNAIRICKAIAEQMALADEKNRASYEKNLAEYLGELSALDKLFEGISKGGKRDCIAFADRFPFVYLTDAYGLRHFEVLEGCSSDTEPTLTAINELCQSVKNEEIPVVFYIEFSSRRVADKVSELTGAKQLLFHSCHNISRDDFLGGATYISLMEGNAEGLKEALG